MTAISTGRLIALEEAADEALRVNAAAAGSAISDATRALKRIAKRAEPLPADYEDVELVPNRGPTVAFRGRRLAAHEFLLRSSDHLYLALEVWETAGGALIAVSTSFQEKRERGVVEVRVTVVEPSEDVQAMRFAVLSAFEWHDRARSMVRKLGWSLRKDVP